MSDGAIRSKLTLNRPPFRHIGWTAESGEQVKYADRRPLLGPCIIYLAVFPVNRQKAGGWAKITSLQKPGSSVPKRRLVGVGGYEFPAWLSPPPPCSNPVGSWKEFSILPLNAMVTLQARAMGLLGASSPGLWRHTVRLKG